MQTSREVLSRILPDHKNLLYLASGPFRRDYETLDFDNVVLVDKNPFPDYEQPNQPGPRISCVQSDCAKFLVDSIEADVKFDVVVIINEGWDEGGFSYPLHTDWFLGLLVAAVRDDYVHIACHEYYREKAWAIYHKFLHLPFTKTELNHDDDGFLDPQIFCDMHWQGAKAWHMQRTERRGSFELGNVHCSVRHQSVWENREDYDLIIVPEPFGKERELWLPSIQARVKTMQAAWTPAGLKPDFDTLEELLCYCHRNRVTRVAMLPWALGKYKESECLIREYNQGPLQIDFYHLNEGDFVRFYNIAARSSRRLVPTRSDLSE